MTSQVSLPQLIEQAKSLSQWLHRKTNNLRIPIRGSSDHYFIGGALLQQALDLADAIIILLERNLPGAAWTLARPLFECYVRCIWILESASKTNIKQFQNGKVPRFNELLDLLETEANVHARWIRSTHKNMKHFHDFTHGGIEHVLRRINKNVVEPQFPDNELTYLVRLGIEIRIRLGYEVFSPTLLDDKDVLKELRIIAKKFCRIPLT